MKHVGINMKKRLTTTPAAGNFSARNLELTPTEQPMSRMSLITHLSPEYFKWWFCMADNQGPRTLWLASWIEDASGIALFAIDIVAASASDAAW
jgi:hypothetical protein